MSETNPKTWYFNKQINISVVIQIILLGVIDSGQLGQSAKTA